MANKNHPGSSGSDDDSKSGSKSGGESRDDESISKRGDDDSSSGSMVGDTIKKLVTAGISAAFMTEESVRGFVSEMKLPKESLNLILHGAAKSKEELMNRIGREIVGIISKIDFVKEASRFVEEHKFRVTAEIDVVRKDHAKEHNKDHGRSSDGGDKT
jgi:hypothetical protein